MKPDKIRFGDKQRKSKKFLPTRLFFAVSLIFLVIFLLTNGQHANVSAGGGIIYLPSVSTGQGQANTPRIHIPFFDVEDVYRDRYSEMAIFWFGKVTPDDNYTHIRMGYNRQRLTIEVNIYDKEVWYDEHSPSANEVENWDATSIYLSMPPVGGGSKRLLRFDAQLSHWQDRVPYQAAFERTANSWKAVNIPFETHAVYRGEGINAAADDKGWWVNFEIPFQGLGMGSYPANQSEWRMGARVIDQDIGPGSPTRTQVWPNGLSATNEDTYARIAFGYPPLNTPALPVGGTTIIRQGLNNTHVPDGSVGGWATCGGSLDYWSEWGNKVYDSGEQSEKIVVQNQKDVSDFPCFSRYYITFPVGSIPPGKVILSAKLILHQFGNSNPAEALPSYIQVLRVQENWQEKTLSWNNSPQVFENYPGTWVPPLKSYPGIPGVARAWDVTQALKDSIADNASPLELRLALQSADIAMHSGKYFWASETASWSSQTPPMLVVQWANP